MSEQSKDGGPAGMMPVWVQNLISHIDGTVTFTDEWKAIFIKQLRALPHSLIEARAEVYEEIASQHEEDAQEYNRMRDPGMANHQRKYAKRYRDKAAALRARSTPPCKG